MEGTYSEAGCSKCSSIPLVSVTNMKTKNSSAALYRILSCVSMWRKECDIRPECISKCYNSNGPAVSTDPISVKMHGGIQRFFFRGALKGASTGDFGKFRKIPCTGEFDFFKLSPVCEPSTGDFEFFQKNPGV